MTVGAMESVDRDYLCEVMVQIAWRSIDRWRRREYVLYIGGGWSSVGGGGGSLCSNCNLAKIRKDQNIVRVVVEVVCSSGP